MLRVVFSKQLHSTALKLLVTNNSSVLEHLEANFMNELN